MGMARAPPDQIPAYVSFPSGDLSNSERIAPRKAEYLFKLSDLTVTGTVVDRVTRQPIKCFGFSQASSPGRSSRRVLRRCSLLGRRPLPGSSR